MPNEEYELRRRYLPAEPVTVPGRDVPRLPTVLLDLHPDTLPHSITAAQCEEVRAAVECLNQLNRPFDPLTLSRITCLPVWNVKRSLESLGLTSVEKLPLPMTAKDMADELAAVKLAIRKSGPLTLAMIVKATGLSIGHVRSCLEKNRAVFESTIWKSHKIAKRWSLVNGKSKVKKSPAAA